MWGSPCPNPVCSSLSLDCLKHASLHSATPHLAPQLFYSWEEVHLQTPPRLLLQQFNRPVDKCATSLETQHVGETRV